MSVNSPKHATGLGLRDHRLFECLDSWRRISLRRRNLRSPALQIWPQAGLDRVTARATQLAPQPCSRNLLEEHNLRLTKLINPVLPEFLGPAYNPAHLALPPVRPQWDDRVEGGEKSAQRIESPRDRCGLNALHRRVRDPYPGSLRHGCRAGV